MLLRANTPREHGRRRDRLGGAPLRDDEGCCKGGGARPRTDLERVIGRGVAVQRDDDGAGAQQLVRLAPRRDAPRRRVLLRVVVVAVVRHGGHRQLRAAGLGGRWSAHGRGAAAVVLLAFVVVVVPWRGGVGMPRGVRFFRFLFFFFFFVFVLREAARQPRRPPDLPSPQSARVTPATPTVTNHCSVEAATRTSRTGE